jgi:hypothetical protein
LLGIAANSQCDFARAREVLEESVRLFRELDDEHNTLEANRILAWTYRELGDLHRSRALIEDNLHRARAVADKHIESTSLEALAGYALDENRVEDASRC